MAGNPPATRDMEKVFNDCVHGHISLHPLCVKIIDTPEFQRLRNIKQLGLTYYVYPGASHNRFEHSLGVCYLAGRMVDALRRNSRSRYPSGGNVDITPVEQLCVEIAGLCHDIGHGPFSHTWEQILAKCDIKWQHEEASVKMFDYIIEKNGLLPDFEAYEIGQKERLFIKELIKGEGTILFDKKPFLYQIVANKENDIDVDKWDYFLRDGMQLNIKITFDYHRLLEFCSVVRHPEVEAVEEGEGSDQPAPSSGKSMIGFRNKEFNNLWDMFRVRLDLHKRAYQHKVVKNIDLMLIDAIVMADKVYKLPVADTKLSEAHKNMEVLASLTDHIFYSIYNDSDPKLAPAKQILKRILQRKLYSCIGCHKLDKQILSGSIQLSELKRRVEDVVRECSNRSGSGKGGELRSCIVKLDCGQHVNPLSKVVLFDKWMRQVYTPDTNSEMADYQMSGPLLEVYVYSTTHNLPEEERVVLWEKVRDELKNLEEVILYGGGGTEERDAVAETEEVMEVVEHQHQHHQQQGPKGTPV